MMDIFNRQAPMPWGQLPTPSLDMGAKPLAPISGMPAKPPNMDLDALMAICGPGMQGPAGGNGRVGYRTANGDTGLQGANMPQPQRPSWTAGLSPTQGGVGMFGVTRSAPQPSGPMSYGGMGFGGGAPQQGGPAQMPAFQIPQPMPLMPQQPMPGMQPYNFSQQMGQTAPPSPMTGQMKGMFGVR